MTTALSVTGADLVRALERAVAPAIDRALRERAEEVAREMSGGVEVVRIHQQADGVYAVVVRRDRGRSA
jgi:hypothetical protein